jgi:serine/threonine protein kinase
MAFVVPVESVIDFITNTISIYGILGIPEDFDIEKMVPITGVLSSDGAVYKSNDGKYFIKQIPIYKGDDIKKIEKMKKHLESEIILYSAISSTECSNTICRFVGYDYDNDFVYIISEYGGPLDLFAIYRSYQGAINMQTTIGFMKNIIDAVECMHSHGFAHRDIKLENIIVGDNGIAQLSDFGFCKVFGDTYISTIVEGTRPYVAPEIFERHQDHANLGPADIYALGVLFFYMILLSRHDPAFNHASIKRTIALIKTLNTNEIDINFSKVVDSINEGGNTKYTNKVGRGLTIEINAALEHIFGLTMESFFADDPNARVTIGELKARINQYYSGGKSRRKKTKRRQAKTKRHRKTMRQKNYMRK